MTSFLEMFLFFQALSHRDKDSLSPRGETEPSPRTAGYPFQRGPALRHGPGIKRLGPASCVVSDKSPSLSELTRPSWNVGIMTMPTGWEAWHMQMCSEKL